MWEGEEGRGKGLSGVQRPGPRMGLWCALLHRLHKNTGLGWGVHILRPPVHPLIAAQGRAVLTAPPSYREEPNAQET